MDVVHPHDGTLFSHEKDRNSDTHYDDVDQPQTQGASERSRHCVVPFIVSTQHGQIRPQKLDWRLPGAGERGDCEGLNRHRALLWEDDNTLEVGRRGG